MYTVMWHYIFYTIEKINYRHLINNFRTQLQTMSSINLIRFFRDLVFNRLNDNINFRTIGISLGLNYKTLYDTKNKRLFWLGFTFSIIVYRWMVLFKKIILWPFKLGIFSFFYSIFGVDVSWFLSWFDYFTFNIPHWVYIQYLTLYNNWLGWWNNNVNIKNLNTISLPERLDKNNLKLDKSTDSNLDESVESNWINKKNIIIGLTVIALIGVGVWYYFYYSANGIGNGGAGNGGNNLPPQDPTQNLDPTIEIFDRQTGLAVNTENLNDTQRLALVDRADRLRNSGRISGVEHQQLLNNILPPAPSYEGPVNIPTNEGSTSTPITAQTDVPSIVVQPATPIEGSSQAQMGDIPRPPSPAGSDDSSETIRNYSYGDPADRRYAFSRRSFDPSYRRDN